MAPSDAEAQAEQALLRLGLARDGAARSVHLRLGAQGSGDLVADRRHASIARRTLAFEAEEQPQPNPDIEGAPEGWIDFFLDGLATIADEAVTSARDLFKLVNTDRMRLLAVEAASVSALRLFEQLPRHPILTVASAIKLLDTSKPTAARAIEVLAEIGILVETTGEKRDRIFAYRAYMERPRSGTELDARR